MSKTTLLELIKNIKEMPPLPLSIAQVVEITNNPDFSTEELSKVIEYDPALTTNILKLANSPIYGFSNKISTISHAIVCLGREAVRSAALTSFTQGILDDEVSAFDLEKGMLWEHSMFCAVSSRIIALRVRYNDPEEAYIAGLLLDIGKLILCKFAAEKFAQILEKTNRNKTLYNVAEQQVLGFDHPTIGGKMMKNWGLPQVLVEAVQSHHSPVKAKTNKVLAYIVHLADAISEMLGIGLGSAGLMYDFEKESLSVLGLSTEDVESIMEEVVDKMHTIEPQLS